jgi:hypothetical protein
VPSSTLTPGDRALGSRVFGEVPLAQDDAGWLAFGMTGVALGLALGLVK